MAPVVLESVSKVYAGNVLALHGVDLEVYDRELLVLVGPSGCGKTTTLRLIAGLEEPTAGEIRLAGRSASGLAARQRGVALVPDGGALLGHRSVRGNVAFGLELRYWSGLFGGLRRGFLAWHAREKRIHAMIARKVLRTAKLLGIEELLDRRPAQLSAGERGRAALARALVRRAGVLLLDEPLAHLDPSRRADMRSQLKLLIQALGTTTICVTHDHVEAMALGDRIAVMNAGRIAQVGSPREVYRQPATRQVAAFLGGMNFLEGQLVETAGVREFLSDRSDVRFAVTAPWRGLPLGPITLGLRREAFERTGEATLVTIGTGVVRLVEWQGDAVLTKVVLSGGDEVEARFSARRAPRESERIELRVDLSEACWFDTVGRNVDGGSDRHADAVRN